MRVAKNSHVPPRANASPKHDDEAQEPRPSDQSLQPIQPHQQRDYVKTFERLITTVLIVMMALVVVLAIVDLAWVLIKDIISPPLVLLDVDELLDVFGVFLLVLIGIELLETLRAYVRERVIRAEVIILVATIALARKIITLDVKAVPSVSLLGMAAIIVALGVSYYLIRRTHTPVAATQPPEDT